MDKKNIIIEGKNFTEVDFLKVTVPDCFVSKNKLVTSSNFNKPKPSSGESRIYIGSQDLIITKKFFFFNDKIKYRDRIFELSNNSCYFTKSNLLKYMKDAKNEYYYPTLNYFYDITADYENYVNKINNFCDLLSFNIFYHKGKDDNERFYINSLSEVWDLFRKISLPKITTLYIYKMKNNEDNIIYLFEIKLDEKYSSKDVFEKIQNEEKKIEEDDTITATERKALITARNGQGKYKNNLLKTMKQCPFTKISDRNILRASHIKPWVESTNEERLDGYNGLLLTPTYDVLFDKGLISFEDDGRLILSPQLSKEIRDKLNLIEGNNYDIANSSDKRSIYLEYHRNNILKR